ncbi:MAG: EpsG family protein [Cecembia sp.]
MTMLLLFFFFFGLTFVVPEDVEGAADSARYARELRDLHSNPLTFEQFKSYLYSDETNKVDIYQPFVTWMISLFTNNPKWLFACFALVFGYFYLKNLKIIIEEIEGKYHFLLILMLILFALTNPIWNINGVRMWTAAQVFLFGILLFYVKGQRIGFLWATLSLVIHFSFLFPLSILILYQFVPKNTWALFFIFLGTFLVNELNMEFIRNFSESLPSVFKSRVNVYTHEHIIESFKDISANQYSLHVILARKSYSYLILFLLAFIFMQREKLKNQNVSSLCLIFLNLALYFKSWANLAALLPFGGRFMLIADSLTSISIIFYFAKGESYPRIGKILYFLVPIILFTIVFKIREGADYFGFLTILGNPVVALFVEDNVPFIEFVKVVF